MVAVVEDGDDVRVIETRECACFEEKPLLESLTLFIGGFQARRREELEGDETVQRLLTSPVNRGLSTPSDALLYAELVADERTWTQDVRGDSLSLGRTHSRLII